MLTALREGTEDLVLARDACRTETFRCGGCGHSVVLKAGHYKIAHFAHRPGSDCAWSTGETMEHYTAKMYMHDLLKDQGLPVQIERPIETLRGDRRADVLTVIDGKPAAFEMQHSSLCPHEMLLRTYSYLSSGIRVCWIPVFGGRRKSPVTSIEEEEGGYYVGDYWLEHVIKVRHEYSFTRWEKTIACYQGGFFNSFDADKRQMWGVALHVKSERSFDKWLDNTSRRKLSVGAGLLPDDEVYVAFKNRRKTSYCGLPNQKIPYLDAST